MNKIAQADCQRVTRSRALKDSKNPVTSQSLDDIKIVRRAKKTKKSIDEPQNKPVEPLTQIKEVQQKTQETTKQVLKQQDSKTISLNLRINKHPQIADYFMEIKQYVEERDQLFQVDSLYLQKHTVLTNKLRTHLVRYIYKIFRKFELKRKTLHLAVLYMDLFFEKQSKFKDALQTVEVAQACIFMAMKYEEIYPPEISQWVDYKHRQKILQVQAKILTKLDFQLNHMTLQHYYQQILWQAGHESRQVTHMLIDLSLFDLSMRKFKTQELAVCLKQLGEKSKGPSSPQKMLLASKWMVERNNESTAWLLENYYPKLSLGQL